MDQLLEWGQPVDIQGLDIRLFDDWSGEALQSLKHHKSIKFAYDNPRDNIDDKIEHLLEYIKPYKLMCYVLVGYWSNAFEDYYRVIHLWEKYKIHAFSMPFDKSNRYQKDFSRWCNNKFIFKKASWFEYQESKGRIYFTEEEYNEWVKNKK